MTRTFRGDWFSLGLTDGWRSEAVYRFTHRERAQLTVSIEALSSRFLELSVEERFELLVAMANSTRYEAEIVERAACRVGGHDARFAVIEYLLPNEVEAVHCVAVCELAPARQVVASLDAPVDWWDAAGRADFLQLLAALRIEPAEGARGG